MNTSPEPTMDDVFAGRAPNKTIAKLAVPEEYVQKKLGLYQSGRLAFFYALEPLASIGIPERAPRYITEPEA